jgi:hypothetical protein
MVEIDITMTATLRPSIVERTFISITKNIIKEEKDRYRLIINVDPIGEKIKAKNIISIAKKYFNHIIFNYPQTPSFPNAVKWVWENSLSNYIFHIEDDWEINREIDINDMIKILDKYKDLSSLRLNKFRTPNKNVIEGFFSGIWDYIPEDKFYICRDWEKQFCLNPNFIKREFIVEAFPRMVSDVDPEKQFRESQKYMRDLIKKWKYGVYSRPGDLPLVTDIGRAWRAKNKFEKNKGGGLKNSFIVWGRGK